MLLYVSLIFLFLHSLHFIFEISIFWRFSNSFNKISFLLWFFLQLNKFILYSFISTNIFSWHFGHIISFDFLIFSFRIALLSSSIKILIVFDFRSSSFITSLKVKFWFNIFALYIKYNSDIFWPVFTSYFLFNFFICSLILHWIIVSTPLNIKDTFSIFPKWI